MRKSYEALFNHNEWPQKVDPNWRPFKNLVCFFLYLGLNDPELGMTRRMLRWIINLLLTMKLHRIINDKYWIPSDDSTVAKWDRYFVKPPVCELIVHLHLCHILFEICVVEQTHTNALPNISIESTNFLKL